LAPRFYLAGAAAGNFGYLLVLAASYAAARSLGLRPVRTLIAEVAPALVTLYAAALLTAMEPPTAVRTVATAALLAVALGLSLGSGRASLLTRASRRSLDVAAQPGGD